MGITGSNRGKQALVVFGAAEDLSTWSVVGTPVVTGSQTDPFGGTGAYSVNDNDGAVLEFIHKTVTFLEDGQQLVAVFLDAGTSNDSTIRIRDTTVAADRLDVGVTWAAGVPTYVMTVGTKVADIALGNNWYLLLALTNGALLKANTNRWELYPTSTTAADTGTTIFYVRHVLVLGEPLDEVNAYSQPRAGSEYLQTDGGLEDAWKTGDDWVLEGRVRWIPATPQVNPRPASPWNGDGELAGINTGWDFFLETWARDKQTFLWVPDRAVSATNISSFLMEPMKGAPPLESDFTRSLPLKIRSSTAGVKYKGY